MSDVVKKVKKFFVNEAVKVILPAGGGKPSPGLKPNRIATHTHKPPSRADIRQQHEMKHAEERRSIAAKKKVVQE